MSKQAPWRKVLGWFGLLVAAVVVVAVGIYVVFWPLSDLIARHDVGAITGPHRAAALQAARDTARGRLLAFGAGLFAAGALVYTARNFSLSRVGQVTDRYTKAIEQLGSDKLDVRIGGIYALERVARDSAKDHPTVMEVLTAFIREHSREQWLLSGLLAADDVLSADAPPQRGTRPDVQAALTVIGRRNPRHDRELVMLDHANLPRANLRGANLTGVVLYLADLTGADLYDADLRGANLRRAHFRDAHLAGANLAGADLYLADLRGANLTYADLTYAHLGEEAGYDADLTGATWQPDEAAPRGWQRDTTGRLKQADTNSGGAATH